MAPLPVPHPSSTANLTLATEECSLPENIPRLSHSSLYERTDKNFSFLCQPTWIDRRGEVQKLSFPGTDGCWRLWIVCDFFFCRRGFLSILYLFPLYRIKLLFFYQKRGMAGNVELCWVRSKPHFYLDLFQKTSTWLKNRMKFLKHVGVVFWTPD